MSEGKTYTQEAKELRAMVEQLSKDISEIKQALLGNEFGEVGLVRKLISTQAEVEELKKFKDRIVWTSLGIGAGSGGFIALLIEYIVQ